jgi:hypothetical protein
MFDEQLYEYQSAIGCRHCRKADQKALSSGKPCCQFPGAPVPVEPGQKCPNMRPPDPKTGPDIYEIMRSYLAHSVYYRLSCELTEEQAVQLAGAEAVMRGGKPEDMNYLDARHAAEELVKSKKEV